MNEANLTEILEDLRIEVNIKNHRDWLVCHCPFAPLGFHEGGTDDTPGFHVKIEQGGVSAFHCYSCKQHGTIPALAAKLGYHREEDTRATELKAFVYECPSEVTAFDDLANQTQEPLEPLESEIYLKMYPLAWEDNSAKAYLETRGVSEEASRLLDLRFDPNNMRILFPVYGPNRELYGFTGRTILPRRDWNKNYPKVRDYAGLKKRRLILGEHLARQDGVDCEGEKPFLIVEGLFALARAITCGAREFCDPIAVMGSHIGEEKRDLIVDWGKPAFLLFDDDMAGDEGLFGPLDGNGEHEGGGAVDMLKGEIPTRLCLYPTGIEDPDDLEYEDYRELILGGLSEIV